MLFAAALLLLQVHPGLGAMGALFVADGLLHRAVDDLPPIRCHARNRLRSPNITLTKITCIRMYIHPDKGGPCSHKSHT